MSLFSKIKYSILDFTTGNSINYSLEENIYKEILSLLEQLEKKLERIISLGTLNDDWALIEFQNGNYTLPMLESLINENQKKSSNCSTEEMNKLLHYTMELQKLYDRYERTVKKRIVKIACEYEKFDEVFAIVSELRKILLMHMNIDTIKQCGYCNKDSFPSYSNLIKLKLEITKRRAIMLPYLSEIDYNKGR